MIDEPATQLHDARRSPPTLPYADPISQFGVIVERRPGATTVIVPPAKGLRMLLTPHWAVIILFGVRALAAWQDGEFAPMSTVLSIGSLLHLLYTFWRRRIFVVSDTDVRFGRLKARGYIWEEIWPRNAIGEIKVNQYNGKLLIRITGRDMKEYFISSNRNITRSVAELLNAELATAPIGRS